MIILFSTFIATEPNAFSYFIVNIQFRHSTKTKRHFYYLLILNSYMPICCKLDVDRGAFTLHCANDCLHWNAGNPIYGIDSRLFYIRHVNIVSGFVFVWVSEKYSVVTFLNFTLSLLALIKNSARKWNVCVCKCGAQCGVQCTKGHDQFFGSGFYYSVRKYECPMIKNVR